jgi:hypothetical protein
MRRSDHFAQLPFEALRVTLDAFTPLPQMTAGLSDPRGGRLTPHAAIALYFTPIGAKHKTTTSCHPPIIPSKMPRVSAHPFYSV